MFRRKNCKGDRIATVECSRALLGGLGAAARLYMKGRTKQNGRSITKYKMRGREEVPVRHHRAPTKPQRRRARKLHARQRRHSTASAALASPDVFAPPASEWPYPADSTPEQRRAMRKTWEREGVAMLEMRLELGS